MKRLKIRHAREHIDEYCQLAASQNMTYLDCDEGMTH
jgi:hypothetical protein